MTAPLFADLDDAEVVEVHRITATATARFYRTGQLLPAREMRQLADDIRAELAARRGNCQEAPRD